MSDAWAESVPAVPGRHAAWHSPETRRIIESAVALGQRAWPAARSDGELEFEFHFPLCAVGAPERAARCGVVPPMAASEAGAGAGSKPPTVAAVVAELCRGPSGWGFAADAPRLLVEGDWGTVPPACAALLPQRFRPGPAVLRVCAQPDADGAWGWDWAGAVLKSKSTEALAMGASVARVQVAVEEPAPAVLRDANARAPSGVRAKVEWALRHSAGAPFIVAVRLELPLPAGAPVATSAALAARAFASGGAPALCALSRSLFSGADAGHWYGGVWRAEVELAQPCPTPGAALRAGLMAGVLHDVLSAATTPHDARVRLRTHALADAARRLLQDPVPWQADALRSALAVLVAAGGGCVDFAGRPQRTSRPKDALPVHAPLAGVTVTPKLDGREAFVVVAGGRVGVLLRDQTLHTPDPVPGAVAPLLLEGELMDDGTLFVYDAVVVHTDRAEPVAQQPHAWRVLAIARALAEQLPAEVTMAADAAGAPPRTVRFVAKPFFRSAAAPHAAVAAALRHMRDALAPRGWACDGLVLTRASGAYWSGEAFKLKPAATVDALLRRWRTGAATREVLFCQRDGDAVSLRSLTDYAEREPPGRGLPPGTLPALVSLPPALEAGAGDEVVAELLLGPDGAPPRLLRLREAGKRPNHTVGVMDIAWSGSGIDGAPDLAPGNGGGRALAPGGWPAVGDAYRDGVRRFKQRLVDAHVRAAPAGGATVVDLGGAGGDARRAARICGQDGRVLLVDVDPGSLQRGAARCSGLCATETHLESLEAPAPAGWAESARRGREGGATAVFANFVLGQALRDDAALGRFLANAERALAPGGVVLGILHDHARLRAFWTTARRPGCGARALLDCAPVDPGAAAARGGPPAYATMRFHMPWSATARAVEEAALRPQDLFAAAARRDWHATRVTPDVRRLFGTFAPPPHAALLAQSLTGFVLRRRSPARLLVPVGSARGPRPPAHDAPPPGFRVLRVGSVADVACAALVVSLPPSARVALLQWPADTTTEPARVFPGGACVVAPAPPHLPATCLVRLLGERADVIAVVPGSDGWGSVPEAAANWAAARRATLAAFAPSAVVPPPPEGDSGPRFAQRIVAAGPWLALPANGSGKVLFRPGGAGTSAAPGACAGVLPASAWVVLDEWFHDTLRHWPHDDGHTPPVSAVWLRVGTRRAADAAIQSLELAVRASVAQYLLGGGGVPSAHGGAWSWSWLWLVPPAHAAPQHVWPQALAAVRSMVADGRPPPGTTCVVLPGAPPPDLAAAEADMAALGGVAWLVIGTAAVVAVVPAPKGAPAVTVHRAGP